MSGSDPTASGRHGRRGVRTGACVVVFIVGSLVSACSGGSSPQPSPTGSSSVAATSVGSTEATAVGSTSAADPLTTAAQVASESLDAVVVPPDKFTWQDATGSFSVDYVKTAKSGTRDADGHLPPDGYEFRVFSAGWTGSSSAPDQDPKMTWNVHFGEGTAASHPTEWNELSTATVGYPVAIVFTVTVPTSSKQPALPPVFTLRKGNGDVFKMNLVTGAVTS